MWEKPILSLRNCSVGRQIEKMRLTYLIDAVSSEGGKRFIIRFSPSADAIIRTAGKPLLSHLTHHTNHPGIRQSPRWPWWSWSLWRMALGAGG
jgi:hypothetical protein